MAHVGIQAFQIDVAGIANDATFQSNNVLDNLGNVNVSAVAFGEVLVYQGSPAEWQNNTLAEAGISAVGHVHDAADITFTAGSPGNIAAANVQDALTELDAEKSAIGHTHGLSDLSDTTFAALDFGDLIVAGGSPFGFINQSLSEAGLAKVYHIDITTGVALGSPAGSPSGSPATLGMLDATLPAGWTTAYNSVGNFTITHNLGNAEVGFALSVIYNGTARVLNPITITTNAVTFQITDTLNAVVEGNVIGKLLF